VGTRAVCLGAVVLTLAIYAPVMDAPFVYEDANWTDQLTSAHHPFMGGWPGRALTHASYRVQAVDGVAYPRSYHLGNLLIHLLVGWGVWHLGRRLGLSVTASALALCVFLWHPLNTQAVAYVSARSDLLMALFAVSGVLVALWQPEGWLRAVQGAGMALAVFLAAWSKEVGLVSAALLLVTAWLFRGAPWWRWGLVAGAVVVACSPRVWMLVSSGLDPQGGYWPTVGLWLELATANVIGIWRVLALSVIPVGMSIDPDLFAVPFGARLVASLVLVLTVGLALWRGARLERWAVLSVLIVLLPRVLVPSLEPIHDHQAYLAMVPLSLVAGTWITGVWT
jgi:hypothetical protein